MTKEFLRKKISEINEKDKSICLIGKIEKAEKDWILLDDGSGKIKIFKDKDKDFKEKEFLRVYCFKDGKRVNIYIAQKINKEELNLFNKIEELYREAGIC